MFRRVALSLSSPATVAIQLFINLGWGVKKAGVSSRLKAGTAGSLIQAKPDKNESRITSKRRRMKSKFHRSS
jgi:hypothetical protein